MCREETTVTSVYYNAFTSDNALLSLAGELGSIDESSSNVNTSAVTSFSLKQLTSKVSHLQTTGAKLLEKQTHLIDFCTDFVREIRGSCEKWESSINTDEEGARGGEGEEGKEKETEDEKLKAKAVKDSKNQMKEDAARGLRMVVRQLNKKRIEINGDIAKEREKLFKVMENARVLMAAVEGEMKKFESMSAEDKKVFSDEEIADQQQQLKSAHDNIKSFFDEHQIKVDSNSEVGEEKKEENKMEESIDISDNDLKETRSLGVGSGKILNKQMTANFGGETASAGRLNCKAKAGGWVGGEDGGAGEQFLQIDLKRQAIVTSVSTQGLFIEMESYASTPSAPKKYRTEKRMVKKQVSERSER